MANEHTIASQKCEKTGTSRGEARPRILARQLARPLTAEEIDVVAGARLAAGGTCSAGTCCVPDCDD